MIRIHIICEGQTEEMFLDKVVFEVFLSKKIHLIPTLIGKPGHKGGNLRYERLLTDIRVRLLEDTTAYCTTFFDFYGLPRDFPGKKAAAAKVEMFQKADCLLDAFTTKLRDDLGEEPLRRFIPYVQMYEFEGLLFSNPEKLAQGIGKVDLSASLQEIRAEFASPEEINDSPNTAPSKRITSLYSAYDKPAHGSLAAINIGLDIIRQECNRFDGWLKKLEALQPLEHTI